MSVLTDTRAVLAHAALHCNLNTVDLPAAEAFYTEALGLLARMRSVSTSTDATPMGLGTDTASTTVFLYDHRGPRAAPALELVGWERPATAMAGPVERGFVALGFRVDALPATVARLQALGHTAEEIAPVRVQGVARSAVRLVDPDGVPVEVVAIPAGGTSDTDGAALAYTRLACADLERTIRWYRGVGFEVRARARATAALVLPEDPTFSLELTERPAPTGTARAANSQGLYRLALAVEDVTAAHALLAARGAVPDPVFIPMPDTPTGGFTVLFLADPDGTVVEFVERPRSAVRRPASPV
ncbi:VOC family protein [Cryptosporangium aurantiacum]|uniref:Catechol 2,3-dioxygenase n=1 Tax=Cryptosporangium aurantiacum TaxID=134849 RepID=A0A1M7PNH6_9ACTN|nr:VOC family protein [Cryptosporangium aurantiacum]SHN18768.1 Catechol 2,3-dioxygenase [Cryptosporangium aurantiacum]